VFRPINSLVISRNHLLPSLNKVWLLLNEVKPRSKKFLKFRGFQMYVYFFSGFSGCWVIRIFDIFYWTVGKHMCDRCCHLVAEKCSWSILIGEKAPRMFCWTKAWAQLLLKVWPDCSNHWSHFVACSGLTWVLNKPTMENVRQVVAPIVAKRICENIFYLYVSFLSHFSIKIVSQKMVILSSLSQKLVSGVFPNSQFYDRRQDPSFRNAPTLALSLYLSLPLFACFPFFLFEYK
jgi:hypothetical protein